MSELATSATAVKPITGLTNTLTTRTEEEGTMPNPSHAEPITTAASGSARRATSAVALALLTFLAACGGSTAASGTKPTTAATATSTSTTTLPRPTATVDELVAIPGGRLHVRCVGHGPKTVVLVAGWGDAGDNWGGIEPALTRQARVCSYARFGLGTSDQPPKTQTFETQAQDLHSLLGEIDEPGPYLVVGHSFGGAQAVTFASLYPTEVTGLVLVDASPTSWITASCAVPDDGSDAAKSFVASCSMATNPETNPEHLDAATGMAEAAEITSLGSVPLTVLVAGNHPRPGLAPNENDRLERALATGAQQWAALSSRGRIVHVPDSGHYIQVDQPAVVIHEIEVLL